MVDTLGQLGHDIAYQSSWNFAEIEAGIAYFKPDILLTIGCDIPLRDPALDILPHLCTKYGLFHIYWATEDKIHFHSWSLPFIRRIAPDLIWSLHEDCVRAYIDMGIPSAYLNFAYNPRLHQFTKQGSAQTFALSLIATTHLDTYTYRYESLRELVIPLLRAGKSVNIWGFGWHEDKQKIADTFALTIPDTAIHGYLPYKDSFSVYAETQIVIGVQNALDQVSQRTFEILGSGACMLTSRTPAMEQLFTDGMEVLMSSSAEETLAKVEAYLQQPQACMKIGAQARKKVLATHTYHHRFAHVWPHLELVFAHKKGGGS